MNSGFARIVRIALGLLCIAALAAPNAATSAQMTQLPVVVVLSTGGTIAGRGGSTMSLSESELIAAVPEVKQHADGPLNLVNAVRAAAARESRGKGVLVVMNDEINVARDELDAKANLPQVEIVYAYAEPANPAVIDALAKAGARGIVIAGTGAGGMSDPEKAMAKKHPDVVFVRSNRTGNGRVIPRKEYDDLGMVPADNLNPQKARVLLMLALAKTSDRKELRRIFDEY